MFLSRIRGSTYKILLFPIAIESMLLIAAVIAPKIHNRCGNPKIAAAITQIENFTAAFDAFNSDCGRYPTTEEGFNALLKNPGLPGWKGPYFSGDIPLDPWGIHAYRYESDDGRSHIVCAGMDGIFHTDDDLSSDPHP